jgi:hypothetical protein
MRVTAECSRCSGSASGVVADLEFGGLPRPSVSGVVKLKPQICRTQRKLCYGHRVISGIGQRRSGGLSNCCLGVA